MILLKDIADTEKRKYKVNVFFNEKSNVDIKEIIESSFITYLQEKNFYKSKL